MHVLVADSLDASAVAALEAEGFDLTMASEATKTELPTLIRGVDVLVVRSTKVTAATLEAADRLALVVRAGAGVENIDVAAASARGIHVSNVPGRNAVAVAELTLGLLLAIDRRIPDAVSDLRQGHWRKSTYSQADGLLGKTLGIIGLGQIGLAVAERARAFGLTVLALQRHGQRPELDTRATELGVERVPDLADLLGRCDILSLHIPGGEPNRGLIGAAELAQLRPGAILLNTSRGDVVDGPALLAALDGGLRAGLDVFPDEPGEGEGDFESALAQHPNVVATHHIGASTAQAQRAIAAGVVEVVVSLRDGRPRHCVNLVTGRLGSHTVIVRHFDRVGVLAAVLDVLRRGELNVKQMENRVFQGGAAAVASIEITCPRSDQELPQGLVAELGAVANVLGVAVVAAGTSDGSGGRRR